VRSNQNRLSRLQLGNNLSIVVWKDAFQGRLERFRKVVGEFSVGVTRVAARVVLAGPVHSRWRDIVTTTPDKNLVLAVLVDSLLLVQSLQSTVMPLIQQPRLLHRNPHETSLFQHLPQRTNRTLQKRRVSNINLNAFLGNKLTCFFHFFDTLGAERAIVPSSELVFQIPSTLTVAYQNEGVLVGSLDGRKAAIRGENGIVSDAQSQ
jgi:hypothetical protein